MTKVERLRELDALRGIAAIAVVCFHLTTKFGELYAHPQPPFMSAPLGHYGVQLFFAISGFVIFLTLERTTRWQDFVVSRFSRLYPAFWAGVLLTFAVVSTIGLPGKQVPLSALPANLTMLPGLFKFPLVDGVYWTLQVEIFFYGWMLVLFLSGLLKRIELVLACWLSLHAIYLAFATFFQIDLPYTISMILILKYIPFFAIGLLAYQAYKKSGVFPISAVGLLVYSSVLAFWESTSLGLVHVLCTVVFFLFARGALRVLAARWLVFLGTISYTLYLIHENIGWAFMRVLYAHGVPTQIVIPLVTLLMIGIATLITFLIEKPALSAIRRLYDRSRGLGARRAV